ncbi:MAG: DUF2924 domain-containing protein [Alphaproteobacteria bacterium]|nr:DUF2924 domain-containing protein [Alphaproteobacteria bacterium]
MQKSQRNQRPDNDIARMSLPELRQKWAEYWGTQPHARIGRKMLEKSLEFKLREARDEGLTPAQQARLDHLIAAYKRNPKAFDQGPGDLKPGTKLIRNVDGEKHIVLVKTNCFEYRGNIYGSLSQIARTITGTDWNGWLFFGLKKRGKKP